MAPISIDGEEITGATIDGEEVQEITVDGQVAYTAGPDIPDSGLMHQYEADNLSKSDGDSVSTWPDQEGTDDLTAGNAPTYRTDEINGKPAVSYDFSDYLSVSFSTISTPIQHFLVAKLDSTSENNTLLYDGGSNFQNGVGYDSGSWFITDDDTNFITGGNANTNWNLWDARATFADHELSIDSSVVLNAPDGGVDQTGLTHTARSGRSASNNDADARIAAHLIYDASASGFSESDVRDYLNDKYGPL